MTGPVIRCYKVDISYLGQYFLGKTTVQEGQLRKLTFRIGPDEV